MSNADEENKGSFQQDEVQGIEQTNADLVTIAENSANCEQHNHLQRDYFSCETDTNEFREKDYVNEASTMHLSHSNDEQHVDPTLETSDEDHGEKYCDNLQDKPKFKIFVGGLNRVTAATSLRSVFEQYGNIIDCEVLFDKFTGRSRGFGFITYDSKDALEEVMKKTIEVDGATVEVRRAIPREEARQCQQEVEKEPSGRVFVGGLGDQVNDESLREYFGKFGDLHSASVMIDRHTNRSRGFAFVIYKNPDDADKAIGSHKDLGQHCEAKKAQPRNFGDRNRGVGGVNTYRGRSDYCYPMSGNYNGGGSYYGGGGGGYGGYGRGGYPGGGGRPDPYDPYGNQYGSYSGYNQYYNPYYAAYYAQMAAYGYNQGSSGHGHHSGYDSVGGSPGPSGADRGSRMPVNRSTPY